MAGSDCIACGGTGRRGYGLCPECRLPDGTRRPPAALPAPEGGPRETLIGDVVTFTDSEGLRFKGTVVDRDGDFLFVAVLGHRVTFMVGPAGKVQGLTLREALSGAAPRAAPGGDGETRAAALEDAAKEADAVAAHARRKLEETEYDAHYAHFKVAEAADGLAARLRGLAALPPGAPRTTPEPECGIAEAMLGSRRVALWDAAKAMCSQCKLDREPSYRDGLWRHGKRICNAQTVRGLIAECSGPASSGGTRERETER